LGCWKRKLPVGEKKRGGRPCAERKSETGRVPEKGGERGGKKKGGGGQEGSRGEGSKKDSARGGGEKRKNSLFTKRGIGKKKTTPTQEEKGGRLSRWGGEKVKYRVPL